jgi:hypothetical protein
VAAPDSRLAAGQRWRDLAFARPPRRPVPSQYSTGVSSHQLGLYASLFRTRALLNITRPALGTIVDKEEMQMLRGGLLWLLGIPLPIILLLWFFGVFH